MIPGAWCRESTATARSRSVVVTLAAQGGGVAQLRQISKHQEQSVYSSPAHILSHTTTNKQRLRRRIPLAMLSCFGLSGALAGSVGGGGGLICSETGFWFGLHLPISAGRRWITGATWSCQLAYRL